MTYTCTALIPTAPKATDLTPTHRRFQLRVFSERREKALAELRMVTGIPRLARSLRPDKIYRLVLPKGEVLEVGKDGLCSGVLRGPDGKITEHAKFEKVTPSLAGAAKAIGSQILLVSIAMQLNRIEKQISALSEELHNDRVAEILAGVQQYEVAMLMRDGARRDAAVQHAIQSLTQGLMKVSLELRTRIQGLPEPSNTFWDNWVYSKARRAADQLCLAEDALRAAMHGASALSECYAVLEEPEAGAAAIHRCLATIASCGIRVAADKARLAEVRDRGHLPETPWIRFGEAWKALTQAMREAPVEARRVERGSVAIDFKPRELMEGP
jgi:hypothetical protein